jgi:hypothetical protein
MAPTRVEELLEDIRLVDEARFQTVQSLRRLILSVDPAISEEVKYGGLLYAAGSPFCGVFSYSQHVSLEFSRGAELADPHAALEGEGKKRRHIKIQSRGDVFKKNVRDYVERAFQATPSRDTRTRRASSRT